jgi:hypothetical protein
VQIVWQGGFGVSRVVGAALTIRRMTDPEVLERIAARRVRGALEPLRGKLTKPGDRGWLRKLPDGTSQACCAAI